EQTAWLGRIAMYAALGLSWVRLFEKIVPGRWSALAAASFFLAWQATGNLSGEWLIGGVEAKGFAYAALLWAIGSGAEGCWIRAGAAAGLSASLHPVIGVWGIAALGFAQLARGLTSRAPGARDLTQHASTEGLPSARAGRSWRGIAPPLVCLFCALPG